MTLPGLVGLLGTIPYVQSLLRSFIEFDVPRRAAAAYWDLRRAASALWPPSADSCESFEFG